MPRPLYIDQIHREIMRLNIEELGFPDTIECAPLWSNKLRIRRAGGGILISRRGDTSISELHVFCHVGQRIPAELGTMLNCSDAKAVARAIVDSGDRGTSSLARSLIADLCNGHSAGRMIACFNASRILIDANRVLSNEQLHFPSNGTVGIRENLSRKEKQRIHALLRPWHTAVWQAIATHSIPTVIHHHTYDKVSSGHSPYDQEPRAIRPAGQVFTGIRVKGNRMARLASAADLEHSKSILCRSLRELDTGAMVRFDRPYRCPRIPFAPTINGKASAQENWPKRAIVYEIRKDLMCSRDGVQIVAGAINEISDSLR